MAYKSFYYSLLVIIHSIAESLPFSSSTHVSLFKKLFNKNISTYDNQNFLFLEDFAHGCTAIGLIPFFLNFRPEFSLIILSSKWILIVDAITAFGYFLFKPYIEIFKPTFGLFFTSLILFLLNFLPAPSLGLNFNSNFLIMAIMVGFLQVLAFFPGISRLAIVYVFLKYMGFCNLYAWYFAWISMFPLLILRSIKGFCQLILQNISVKFLSLIFLLGSILAYMSLTFMYDFMLDWQFIFLYPLILGILCLTIFQK